MVYKPSDDTLIILPVGQFRAMNYKLIVSSFACGFSLGAFGLLGLLSLLLGVVLCLFVWDWMGV